MNLPSPSVEATQIARHFDAQTTEFFDGYVLVGFVAGSKEAVIVRRNGTDKHAPQALNALLISAVQANPPAQKPTNE